MFKAQNMATSTTKIVIANTSIEYTFMQRYLEGCIANVGIYFTDNINDTFISTHMKYLCDYYEVLDNPYN